MLKFNQSPLSLLFPSSSLSFSTLSSPLSSEEKEKKGRGGGKNSKLPFDRPKTDDFSSPQEKASLSLFPRFSFLRPHEGDSPPPFSFGSLAHYRLFETKLRKKPAFASARRRKSDHAAEEGSLSPSFRRSLKI